MKALIDIGIMRIGRPQGATDTQLLPLPIVLDCLDRFDASGNEIGKPISLLPAVPPPPARKSGPSGPPSSRRFASGQASRFEREPRTQAELLALAEQDRADREDDGDITQVMPGHQLRKAVHATAQEGQDAAADG